MADSVKCQGDPGGAATRLTAWAAKMAEADLAGNGSIRPTAAVGRRSLLLARIDIDRALKTDAMAEAGATVEVAARAAARLGADEAVIYYQNEVDTGAVRLLAGHPAPARPAAVVYYEGSCGCRGLLLGPIRPGLTGPEVAGWCEAEMTAGGAHRSADTVFSLVAKYRSAARG